MPDFKAPIEDPENGKYMLGRNYIASCRLNLQHYLLKEATGFVLHPSIPRTPDMSVADIATGTGIWLLDLSKELGPQATLRGFDISDQQFPSAATLPANTSFGTFDASSPDNVPPELVGAFDVVHVAIVVAVVRHGNPAPWLAAFAKMLRPGGYLQWNEYSMPAAQASIRDATTTAASGGGVDAAAHPSLAAYLKMNADIGQRAAPLSQWTAELDAHFAAAGFADVRCASYQPGRAFQTAYTTLFLLLGEETIVNNGADPEILKMISDSGADVCRGAVAPILCPVVCVGRKPAE